MGRLSRQRRYPPVMPQNPPTPNAISHGSVGAQAAASSLAQFFASADAPQGGHLMIGYPLSNSPDLPPVDAVFLSPEKGVIVFDLVDGVNTDGCEDRQDNAATVVEIKLKQQRALSSKRVLQVPIRTITYAPGAARSSLGEFYSIATRETIGDFLASISWDDPQDLYELTLSAIQAMVSVRNPTTRRITERDDSRGAHLAKIEGAIATLDAEQSHAVIETSDDVQRIRGLAGSGKTVVLARKAAYLHHKNPELRIAVTFNTRSLKGTFRRAITTFSLADTSEEPDWTKVAVLQAWGAGGGGEREGIYHQFCVSNGVEYLDFGTARQRFGSADPFGKACEHALENVTDPVVLYDVILIDEAQDLPPAFLRMCYNMLGEKKRLVYAYDELQSLNSAGLPPAQEIFGARSSGQPQVSFDGPDGQKRDIILKKCYRNSRPVLTAAHAVGFGIYRPAPPDKRTGLVQIFERKELWNEIGYTVVDGRLEDDQEVALARDNATSPTFLEQGLSSAELIQFIRFEDRDQQDDWVATSIIDNLRVDELRPNDIMVINPNPVSTRNNVGLIRGTLLDAGVANHLAGVDGTADVFFKDEGDSVTFTGVHRAKGNEAAMVYVVNAQEQLSTRLNLASVRNRLFTAITRSKAWVRVTGFGDEMDQLMAEYERMAEEDFRLRFRYPTAEERRDLRIVHRDLDRSTQRTLASASREINEILRLMEAGEVYPEDLDETTLARLKEILGL